MVAQGAAAGGAAGGAVIADLLALGKPRIAAMVGTATAVGALVAAPGDRSIGLVAAAALAAALASAGTAALNQWLERDADGRMARTRGRPLPSGRLRPIIAAAAGTVALLAGVAWMAAAANGLAAALVGVSAGLYLAAYTPLKPRSAVCVWIGAIPGALPPAIGWAAATGELAPLPLVLVAWLVAWQVPHVAALAALHGADYRRVGWHMDPLGPRRGAGWRWGLLASVTATAALGVAPAWLGAAGLAYALIAAALGLAFAAVVARFARLPDARRARLALRTSIAYLPAVLGLLALDALRS